jgi:hypothetical protein
MLKQSVTVKLKNKMLDGVLVGADLKLGTTRPVMVVGVDFLTPARIVICMDKLAQQGLLNGNYQMMQPEPEGVLAHISSSALWKQFDFTKPCPYHDQRVYMRYPDQWAPFELRSATGVLPCMIEARAGNEKHKAAIEITLHLDI